MTDYGKLTDEEVNETIFKAQGWVHLPIPASPRWQRPTERGTDYWFYLVPDFVGEWAQTGKLLDELAQAAEDDWQIGMWNCVGALLDEKWTITLDKITRFEDGAVGMEVIGKSLQRAICEAWLKWKEKS